MSDLAIELHNLAFEVWDNGLASPDEEEQIIKFFYDYYGKEELFNILMFLSEHDENIRWLVIRGVLYDWEVEHNA